MMHHKEAALPLLRLMLQPKEHCSLLETLIIPMYTTTLNIAYDKQD